MKIIYLFFLFNLFNINCFSQNNEYIIKLTNYSKYKRFGAIKYIDSTGFFVEKKFELKRYEEIEYIATHNIFFLYSVSFNSEGKIIRGVNGKDDVSYMKTVIKNKKIFYQKFNSEMYLRGTFKILHLGI